jgi:hypothetical protein
LDARALLRNDEPVFIWKVGKFKNLRTQAAGTEEAIVSFCTSLARAALSAMSEPLQPIRSALEIRHALLGGKSFVELGDLLSYCWGVGVPVLCMKVFPLKAKQMHAMAVKVRDRSAILIARDLSYPAQAAFDIAHELGHIALGHLAADSVIADFEDPLRGAKESDPEELAANEFALEILTGQAKPTVLPSVDKFIAQDLAAAAMSSADELGIDAGTLILCMGHATGRWDKTMAALSRLYGGSKPIADALNKTAMSQLEAGGLSVENEEFLRSALGL